MQVFDGQDWVDDGTMPISSAGGWTWGGIIGGVTDLSAAAGNIIGAVRGNGAQQNSQSAANAQATLNQKLAAAANQKMLLWGGVIVAGLLAIAFILFRKR